MRVILAIILLLPSLAFGANHYVLDGGSGDGSAWDNAWDDFPATLVRGDTYWIGDGTYAPYTFDDAPSGSTFIFITKATAAQHGTETGWDSAYGDGQTVWSQAGTGDVLDIEEGYYDFDGVVGGGPGSWTTGHGFKVTVAGTTGTAYAVQIAADADSVKLRRIEMTHSDPCSVGDYGQDGIRAAGSGADNILVQRCYIHAWKRNNIISTNGNSWVVEYNQFEESHSTASEHGQAIYMGLSSADDWVIRYNVFHDINGSAVIFFSGNVDRTAIYGNLFWEEFESTDCGNFSVGSIIGHNDSGGGASTNSFHNNTVIEFDGRGTSSQNLNLDSGSGNIAYNNIWAGAGTFTFDAQWNTHDYNLYDFTMGESNEQVIADTTIFTDYAGGDFTLASATDAGTATSFDTDMTGANRGGDGVWDRGAFEFDGETPPASSVMGTGSHFEGSGMGMDTGGGFTSGGSFRYEVDHGYSQE